VHNLCINCAQPSFSCAQLSPALRTIYGKTTFNEPKTQNIRPKPPRNTRIRSPPDIRTALRASACAQILCSKNPTNQTLSIEMDNPLMLNPDNPTSEISTRLSRLKGFQSITDRGVRYERRWTDCGSKRCKKCSNIGGEHRLATHGPYWYMVALDPKTRRRKTIYLGHTLDTTLYRSPEGGFDHDAYSNRTTHPEKTRPTPNDPHDLDSSGSPAGEATP